MAHELERILTQDPIGVRHASPASSSRWCRAPVCRPEEFAQVDHASSGARVVPLPGMLASLLGWVLLRARWALDKGKIAPQIVPDPTKECSDLRMTGRPGLDVLRCELVRPLAWIDPAMISVLATGD